jgi:hypothetical protein
MKKRPVIGAVEAVRGGNRKPVLRGTGRGQTWRSVLHTGEAGSMLLSVLFMGAVMIVLSTLAMQNLLTQGRRDREEELIWRGEQYARGVKLFYRKTGRFPTTMDQLTQKQGNLRFMRKPYKELMNREDGSWRLIYVAPNGQLIGSLTRTNILLQIPGQQPQPGQPGAPPRPAGPPGATGRDQPTSQPQPAPAQATFGTGPSTGTGQIIGGNIIGVASKIAQPSIRIYNGGQTYREWEFIWDPMKDAPQQGAPGVVPGAVPGSQPGVRPPPAPPRRP